MASAGDYAVAQERDGAFRLDRITEPVGGTAAFIKPVTDRYGHRIGWRLKPLVTMQGSLSKVWPSPAEANRVDKADDARPRRKPPSRRRTPARPSRAWVVRREPHRPPANGPRRGSGRESRRRPMRSRNSASTSLAASSPASTRTAAGRTGSPRATSTLGSPTSARRERD